MGISGRDVVDTIVLGTMRKYTSPFNDSPELVFPRCSLVCDWVDISTK